MTSRSEYVTSEGCMRRFLACGITVTWQYRNFRGTSISTHSPALGVCGRAGAYRGREGRAIDKSITGLLIHRLLPTLQNPIVSEVKIRAPNLVRRRASMWLSHSRDVGPATSVSIRTPRKLIVPVLGERQRDRERGRISSLWLLVIAKFGLNFV
jgi:hypothetical protein